MLRVLLRLVVVVAFLVTVLSGMAYAQSAAGKTDSAGASSPTSAGAQPQEKQPQEVRDAIELFRKGDYEGTLKLLKEAAQKSPGLPSARLVMAQLFSQSGNAAAARNSLEMAVIENPEDPHPYGIMADVAVRERRVTEALLLYEKANTLVTGWKGPAEQKTGLQTQIYHGMAVAYELRGNWAQAQKELEALLKIDPKNVNAYQELARCLFQQGNPDGALEKLKQAAKLDSSILLPETTLAQYYARSGDQKNANQWLMKALTLAPRDLKTRLVAAEWAVQVGQLKDAKTQADAALKLDPKSVEAKNLCGIVALFEKDYKTAELYFESAHIAAPKSFVATNNLALALAEQKDKQKRQRALEYAENNVRQYPRVGDALSTYGWVLYKLGRLDEAEKALTASAQTGTFGADAAYYLACIFIDRGKEAEARQLLEGALKAPGPFPQREEAQELLKKLRR